MFKIQNFNCEFLGSGGSRLIRGNNDLIENLETQLSKLCKKPASLFFSSGYQCNLGVLSALVQNEDIVFTDQFNHASIIDGLRLTKAQKIIFPHCDLNALEHLLKKNQSQAKRWLVTESLFSMDGDSPDLVQLVLLCEKYDVRLIIDEAHASGLYGQGGGLVTELGLSHRVFATTHMAGKAWGVSGAWVNCDEIIKDYLVNFSRPFIYSTAPSSLQVVSMLKALEHWLEVGESRFTRLVYNMKNLYQLSLDKNNFSPILPYIFSSLEQTLSAQDYFQKSNFDVRAIKFPTVPKDKTRLRITIPGSRTESEVNAFLQCFKKMRESAPC